LSYYPAKLSLFLWKKAGNIDGNTERIPPVFYEIARLNEAI
jgi:hypothetical protein